MQPQQTSPGAYLDEISSQQPKSGMSNRLFFAVIGGVLILSLITVAALVFGGGSKGITPEQLSLRLQALQKTSVDAQKNIKDSQLRAINSRLTASLANTNREIAAPLKAAKVELKKASKTLTQKEEKYIETLTTKLESARLNDEFDSTYSREMAYEMDSVLIMMKALRNKTNSKSLKTFVDTSQENLASIQGQLQNYRPS